MTNPFNEKDKQIVLVIVAHSDDEALGLAGTIARHVDSGDQVYGLSMTDGVSSRTAQGNAEIKLRSQASVNAAKVLGLNWLEPGKFPDNSMDTIPLLTIVKKIEEMKALIKPTLVYTHCGSDLNIDHRIVSTATLTAFRPQPGEDWREIRTFEIASATDYAHKSITNSFYPNLYIDITTTWERKLAALTEYIFEMREAPHSRSFEGLENLARYRGNQVGVHYAEAFEIIRKIER
jgi:LmbE family N-acetylglucosaminyl deacetylase